MEERYQKMLGALTSEEIKTLGTKRVCLVGFGGIGGYAAEFLARMGVGSLTIIDGDNFTESNLNRQLLSSEALIGHSKVLAAALHIREINSKVQVNAIPLYLTEENAERFLKQHDVVIDALDSIPMRRVLADACGRLGLTLVHGAISGWRAQIAVIAPKSGAFDLIYPEGKVSGNTPSLSFTPGLAASIQVAEAVKVLLYKEVSLESKLLVVDLFTQEYMTIPL